MKGIIAEAEAQFRHEIALRPLHVDVVIAKQPMHVNIEKRMGVEAVKNNIRDIIDPNQQARAVKGVAVLGLQGMDGGFVDMPLQVAASRINHGNRQKFAGEWRGIFFPDFPAYFSNMFLCHVGLLLNFGRPRPSAGLPCSCF